MDEPGRADVFRFEGFRFDRAGDCLYRIDGSGVSEFVPLGSRALALLAHLVERQGKLVSKDEIIKAVWRGSAVEEANLTVQISALRRVLDRDRKQGSCIHTISGRGYRFVSAVQRTAAPSAAPVAATPGVAVPAQLDAGRANLPPPAGVSDPVFAQSPPTPKPAPRLSIVVLPFANLSSDPEQDYFVDAVTDDLTTDLSRIADMLVISRGTAFAYKGKKVNAQEIGRELGVRYVLEGSVRKLGPRIRVNAQLIDAETNVHLWAERFDRDIDDLFALQDEITIRIANEVGGEVIAAEAARPIANPDALNLVLRGMAAYFQPPSGRVQTEAINLFEQALALDPASVRAQSLLAIVLAARVLNGWADAAAADLARAERLTEQALAASPASPLAHVAKGQVLRVQGRHQDAIPEYEAALAGNRNWVALLYNLGQCKLLTGAIEEAIPLQEQAIRLSPRDRLLALFYFEIGRVHLLQSRTDEAILWFEKARSGNPSLPFLRAFLASAYGLKGETHRAAAELAEARKLGSDDRYSSLVRLQAAAYFGVPKIHALHEATYLAGLRKAGMPEK